MKLDSVLEQRITQKLLALNAGVSTEEVLASRSLINDGLLTSLGMIRLLAELQDELSVELDVEAVDLQDLESVAGLAALFTRGGAG